MCTGDWHDGLDMPFVFVRDEIYLSASIGALTPSHLQTHNMRLRVLLGNRVGVMKQSLDFHAKHPHQEKVTQQLFTSKEVWRTRQNSSETERAIA